MQIRDGAWAGRRCFIIGGGPSFQGFDYSLLKNELTLGINMAFLFNPTVNLIYDLRLMEKLTADKSWAEYKGVKLWLNSECTNDRNRFQDVQELYESLHPTTEQAMWSTSLAKGLYRGNNAGVAALNLADILGASPIYLMGYDFKGHGGQSANWHNNYPKEWKHEDLVYQSYIDSFAPIKTNIRGRVINLNPDSGLRLFEFNTVEVLGSFEVPKVSITPTKPIRGVVVNGPEGFGDTIYMRPAIKRLAEKWDAVYVRTPWQQLFIDIPKVFPTRPRAVHYRTQNFNVASVPSKLWHFPPAGLQEMAGFYSAEHFRAGMTILGAFMQCFRVSDPVDFSMKVDPSWEPAWLKDVPRPFGVVHPPSMRQEWMNASRNPRPEYIQTLIESRPDVHWISVGFNAPGQEWYEGPPLRGISRHFDNGELSASELLAVLGRADLAVSGPCWLLPAAAALGTPLFCVFGGSIPPQLLIDRRMGGKAVAISPVPFCGCFQNDHQCNKTIPLPHLLLEWGRFCGGLKERVTV